MVVCKYYQQGACKFGQYCRFDHVNSFGAQSAKPYGESKSIVLGVAEEILAAERGGQWLLSCFGPFKEQPCIPGMEDISPEEVRWEMYQAQKNNTVDQTKLQFQQLCEEAKVKREALKNPTHETAALLEKLQKGNRDGTFGTKSTFSMSSSALSNNTTSNNPFSSKPFGTSNTFGVGNFNSPTTNTSMSIFGRSATNNSTVFGGKPAFGGTAVFGGQSPGTSIFGDASKQTTSIFGGGQNMPTFGSAAKSSSFSSFSSPSNTQSIFSQSTNVFSNTQSTTSTFGSNTTTSTSPFSNQTSQTNPPPFGITNQNVFGNSPVQQTNSIFGGSPSTVNPSVSSSLILRQPKTSFGAATLFNSSPLFGTTTPAPTFGGQPTFNTPRNIFGTSTTNATFGSNVQPVNSFSALSSSQNIFTSTQNTSSPFGTITSVSNANNGFGSNQGTGTVFANVFNTPTTPAPPFSQPSAFGSTITSQAPSNTFGTNSFINTTNNTLISNKPTSTFGSGDSNNPFASTTNSITMSNPFISSSQQVALCTGTSSTPGLGGMNFTCKVAEKIDESIYTPHDQLTDEEKQIYLSDQFTLGKIPLKPPSIELR
ncbi:nucleoporin NUP42-like [Chelonus insularis]|uniref:nucleoporin NUP42-like n=1 Tax=Chelonus insularis TaxID=460826 RepID=UPI00158EA143|nr:nucleoporin NUP42-like [Chelonus insularis]